MKLIAETHLGKLTRVLIFVPVLCLAAAIGSVSAPPASAQITNETPPPGAPPSGCDYDQRGNKYCWGGGGATEPDKYVALAVSRTTLVSGTAHGQNSPEAAQNLAEGNCASRASDCKVELWGQNTCVAMVVSLVDGKWGDGRDPNRAKAEAQAIGLCRSVKGAKCVVQASPCASDDPRNPD